MKHLHSIIACSLCILHQSYLRVGVGGWGAGTEVLNVPQDGFSVHRASELLGGAIINLFGLYVAPSVGGGIATFHLVLAPTTAVHSYGRHV